MIEMFGFKKKIVNNEELEDKNRELERKVIDYKKQIDKINNFNKELKDSIIKLKENKKVEVIKNKSKIESSDDNKKEFEKVMEIVENSVVVDDSEEQRDDFGRDLLKIAQEVTDDKNTFRFGNLEKDRVFDSAILLAISERPNYNVDIRQRYEFLRYFMYYYNIGRSAIMGNFIDKFKDIISSLLAFRGALEWRHAGTMSDYQFSPNESNKMIDRLKGFGKK